MFLGIPTVCWVHGFKELGCASCSSQVVDRIQGNGLFRKHTYSEAVEAVYVNYSKRGVNKDIAFINRVRSRY